MCVTLGIIVSSGHSQADFERSMSAFDRGESMATHAFNAMPGLHYREPGLLSRYAIPEVGDMS